MGKLLLFSLLTLASLRSASAEKGEEKFIKEGGSVTLDLRPAPADPITIIQWKFKDSILAEWVEDVVDLGYNRLNTKLDIVSGQLSMEKMNKSEEGVYSVEVNNLVQQVTYNVVLIKDVLKPEIWIAPLVCNPEYDQCTLTCGEVPTGPGPVTYSWKTDNGEWKASERVMNITKKEHRHVETFTCKIKNPVSEKESDPLQNKLYIIKMEESEGSSTGGIVGGIIVALLLAAIGIGIGVWKKDKLPCGKRNIDPEAAPGNENGVANALNEIPTTNTPPNAKPGSEGGPGGGVADPLLEKTPPGSQADPPKPTHEENTDSKDATGEGDAAV